MARKIDCRQSNGRKILSDCFNLKNKFRNFQNFISRNFFALNLWIKENSLNFLQKFHNLIEFISKINREQGLYCKKKKEELGKM